MPTETVVFAHARGDFVKIKANGVKANVLALHLNEDDVQEFLCRYTDKADRVSDAWLKANAIED